MATGLMHANTAALMLLPWLRTRFAGLGLWARLVRLRARFDELLSERIETRRPDTGDSSVLSALLAGNTAAELDPDDLHQQLRTLVVAGHDTTAGALMWALYHNHRESGVRDRVLAELDTATTSESLPELPYLSAVVSEALRMHRSSCAGSPHRSPLTACSGHRATWSAWPHPQCISTRRGGRTRTGSIRTGFSAVRRRRARPPRSVPRGIAVVPWREVRLDVIGRR